MNMHIMQKNILLKNIFNKYESVWNHEKNVHVSVQKCIYYVESNNNLDLEKFL